MVKLFKNYKIYNSERCPCGSDKNYSECCRIRKDKPFKQSKEPAKVQMGERKRKTLIRDCLYPDKTGCVKLIKQAHALQNKKILSQLSVDGHVYMMNLKELPKSIPIENDEPDIIFPIERIGVNHATTATCFCAVHDDEVFAPIEKDAQPFNKHNDEHNFLYAYKTFIFEYYKELGLQKVFTDNFKEYPSSLRDPMVVQMYREMSLKKHEMDEVKKTFDDALLTHNFNIINTHVLEMPESIDFADFACIGVRYDLNGKKIKNIKNNFMSHLFLTIFPESQKSYVIVSYLKKDEKIYGDFARQLLNKKLQHVKFFLTLMLPLYSENIVFSPRLWKKWDTGTQSLFTDYVNIMGTQFDRANLILRDQMRKVKKGAVDIDILNLYPLNLFP